MKTLKIFLLIISFLFTGATLASAAPLDGSVTVTVNPAPVPVNCVGSWSACSNGTQTYTITTNAANGGTACPATNGATQTCGVTGGWSGWSPASCPSACGQSASTQTRTCTSPAPSGGGATCSGSSTNNCPATSACPVNGSCSGTHYSCNSGTSSNNVNGTSSYTWSCVGSNGGGTALCSENKPMTGTLTPANSSCTIASGASSCNVTLTWSTTNPVATSAVTASGMSNVNGNSGSQAFAVPYSSRTFYLYNNSIQLATASATASCVAGTGWYSGACRPPVDGGWSAWNPVSCPSACGQSASTQTKTCTNPSPQYGGATCYGSSTNNCPATAPCTCANGATNPPACTTFVVNGSCSATHYSCNAGTSASNASNSSTWTWNCNGSNGGSNASCSETKPSMTGTISTSASSCTITSGASSCNVTVTWSTSNPVATSAVSAIGMTDVSGNSGSKSMAVPYTNRLFHLYNNSIELDNANVTSSCAAGTSWDGSICAVIPAAMSGSLTATNCTIPLNGTSCNTTLVWSTLNPVGTSSVTTPTNITVATANSNAGKTYSVDYGSRDFYLYNNAVELDSATSTASCVAGTSWDGSKCATITTAVDGGWDNGSCGQCDVSCHQSCTKLCNNPAPANGGANCPGDSTGTGVWNYSSSCSGGLCPSGNGGSGNGALNISFTSNPTQLFKGKTATLTWTSGADSCTGDGNFSTGAGNPPNGSVTVSPTVTTTYKLTCIGGTTENKETTVKVSSITIIER